MRTQVMPERAVGSPWLEHYPSEGGSPCKILLESFPFTIGRNDTCDLRIDSARVSREHAVIARNGLACQIKDLGSTNGTFVNGHRIDEAPLADGDLLVIADVEYTFFSGLPGGRRETVTQVIGSAGHARIAAGVEIVGAVRRWHEALLCRAVSNVYEPVMDLDQDRLFGYEAQGGAGGVPGADGLVLHTECRLATRLHQLERILAVEETCRLPEEISVFVNVRESEMGASWLVDSLSRLRNTLSAKHRLVVEVPDSAVSEMPHFRQFMVRMDEDGIGVAYDGIGAGQGRLTDEGGFCPDFLKVAPSLVRGVHRNGQKQRRIESLVRAGRSAGCEVIAVGVQAKEEAETCRGLGCRLAQGPWFGSPQPIDAISPPDRV